MAVTTNTLIQAEEITNGGILRTAPVNQQLNPSQLSPDIWIAEQTHIVDILGKSLYEDMILEKAGTISNYNDECGKPLQKAFPDNDCYEAFWTLILRRLCGTATVYVALPTIAVHITNNGLVMPETQFAETSGTKGLSMLQSSFKGKLTTLRELTTRYICDNSECLPLGCCPTCSNEFKVCSCGDCDTAPPVSKMQFFSPRKR